MTSATCADECKRWGALIGAEMGHAGLPWREVIVPGTPLWQLFVFDPSGVQLEIIFDSRAEEGPEPDDTTPGVRYRPNEDYFDRAAYERL